MSEKSWIHHNSTFLPRGGANRFAIYRVTQTLCGIAWLLWRSREFYCLVFDTVVLDVLQLKVRELVESSVPFTRYRLHFI